MVMPYQDTRNLYYNNAYGRQAQTLGYDPASPQPTGGAQYRPPPMNFGTSYQNPGGGNWATSALAQAQNPGLDYLGAASTATAQATAAAKAAADKAAADKAAADQAAAATATTATQAAGTLGAPVPGTVGGPNPPAGPPGSMAAPAATAATGTGTLPAWASSTSGRSGKSYAGFLAANPGFDPYTNLDAYVGAGGSQSPVLQQAFGWLNQWARGNGYQDGKNIPAAQRAQMFLAFVERARQGVMDRGENWAQDAASRLPDQGFSYQAGWGLTHGGQSYETQGPATGATAGTASSGGGAGSRTGPVATATTATTATTPAAVPGGGTTVAGTGAFDPLTGQWVPAAGAPTTGAGVPAGAYYQSNPQVAVTNFLAQHGITPDTHSPFGDMLRKIGAGLAPVLAQTIGMGAGSGGAMDQLRDLPTMLSNLIYGNGGSTFGNIGGYAGNVMKNVLGQDPDSTAGKSYLSGMDPSAVENLLKTITGLRGLGMNQYMQNYQQNALQSTLDKYGAADLASQGQANAGDWLIQNDPYGLFRFATAGGGVGAGTGYGQRQ